MDNLISRQDAIDACHRDYDNILYFTSDGKAMADSFEYILNALPPAQPQRMHGRWVEMGQNKDGTHNLCCGVCGKFKFKSRGHANSVYTRNKYKFCGGCGADMRGEENESD